MGRGYDGFGSLSGKSLMHMVPSSHRLIHAVRRLTAIAAVVSAVWAPASAVLAANGVVRFGVDVDAMSLDPRTAHNTTDERVNNLLYDGLVQLDSAQQPQPDLATEWKQIDPTTWLFTLRPDVKFQDGSTVTPEDVVFTYTTLLDPKLHAYRASLFQPIKAVEAVGAHQVRFRLSEPYAPLLAYLEVGIVPRHLVQSGADLSTKPVGSGPYRFVRWDRGNRVVLEANPGYFGGAPA